MWRSDEFCVELRLSLQSHNERLYRGVDVKTDIFEDELLVACDTQQLGVVMATELVWKVLFELYRRNAKSEFISCQRSGAGSRTEPQPIPRMPLNFLRGAAPDFITKDQWPSKSPDLNSCDYSLGGALKGDIIGVEDLKRNG